MLWKGRTEYMMSYRQENLCCKGKKAENWKYFTNALLSRLHRPRGGQLAPEIEPTALFSMEYGPVAWIILQVELVIAATRVTARAIIASDHVAPPPTSGMCRGAVLVWARREGASVREPSRRSQEGATSREPRRRSQEKGRDATEEPCEGAPQEIHHEGAAAVQLGED